MWQSQRHVCEWLVDDAHADWRSLNAYGCNASQWAALRGDVDMCAYLLNMGLDFRVHNRNGHSALHKAAVKGRAAACEWLVHVAGLGAEFMNADADGNTPARMARLEGFVALADWLDRVCRADRTVVCDNTA